MLIRKLQVCLALLALLGSAPAVRAQDVDQSNSVAASPSERAGCQDANGDTVASRPGCGEQAPTRADPQPTRGAEPERATQTDSTTVRTTTTDTPAAVAEPTTSSTESTTNTTTPITSTPASDHAGLIFGMGLFGLFLIAVGLFFYFIPAIVAIGRRHHSRLAIFALNLFLGWSVLGWVAALVWSLTNPAPSQTIIYRETREPPTTV